MVEKNGERREITPMSVLEVFVDYDRRLAAQRSFWGRTIVRLFATHEKVVRCFLKGEYSGWVVVSGTCGWFKKLLKSRIDSPCERLLTGILIGAVAIVALEI